MLTLMAAAAALALWYVQERRHHEARRRQKLAQRLRDVMADAGGEWPDHERALRLRPRLRVEGDGSPAA